MSFATKLKIDRDNKIIDYAIEFAEKIEPLLIESAQKGYSARSIDLDKREDAHILKSPLFLENIELLLEGCKATIEKVEYTNWLYNNKYYKYKLLITWK
ncbi:hypothetical protein BEP19_09905 [Ammoniphilus oxalaticus]|uniref:Uncharacterized protein n=1 Tax=Ammoniphilus oxalaticus TaxID=66863 RepID=A0A419SFM4_9BACL|nr:hypothetical protein [Ammoniphilus oxalaticus]RKD22565.1 hypothetical protein BEP19_09905 [Ammoniphilus oxalaticus]